jgi:hypothetical protein
MWKLLPSRCSTSLACPHYSSTSSKQQGDICTAHVASIYFKCFKYFIRILQVFHLGVAKVDLDVAHIAMTIQVCFKCIFQILHLFL